MVERGEKKCLEMKCIQKTEHQKNLPVIQYNQDYHKVWSADKDRVLVIAESLELIIQI